MRVFPMPEHELLTPTETAQLLRTTRKTLAVWRCNRRNGPPYLKLGAKVLYRRADVEAFITRRTVHPGTMEAAQ